MADGDDVEASQAEVLALRKKRSTYQGFITKSVNWFSKSGTTAGLNRLEVELDSLIKNYDHFAELEVELISIDPEVDEDDPGKKLGEIDNIYCDLKAKLLDAIDSKKPKKPTTDGNVQNNSFLELSHLLASSRKDNLPKLDLPKFDGEIPEDFLDFIHTFDSMVHNNDSLESIDKFRYLKTCLSGKARQIISRMDVLPDNYQTAYDLLRTRYDNKALLVQSHVKKIFDIPEAKTDSATSVRKLIDDTKSHVRALLSLGTKEDMADALLIYLTLSKLGNATRLKWEENAGREVPSWGDFESFLEDRASVLERYKVLEPKGPGKPPSSGSNPKALSRQNSKCSALLTSPDVVTCPYCSNKGHLIQYCPKFLALEVPKRISEAKRLVFCIICLRRGHFATNCKSKGCEICKKRHHTALHLLSPVASTPSPSSQPSAPASGLSVRDDGSTAIIGTVLINLKSEDGQKVLCRALLDSGSTRNFISTKVVQILRPRLDRESVTVTGIGSASVHVKHSCLVKLSSRFDNSNEFNIRCLVLPRITGLQPPTRFSTDDWMIPNEYALADPYFNKPQGIDLLLGSEMFWQILKPGQHRLGDELPFLKESEFGWVVVGPLNNKSCTSLIVGEEDDPDDFGRLDELVERFWRLENVPDVPAKLTSEESRCEAYFENTTTRDENGRYVVRLPFQRNPQVLGQSFEIALRRFKTVEARLRKKPDLYSQYAKFIDEYIQLGHCEVVKSFDSAQPHAFIPHHCVLKPESSTTKLRVVFDGSCRYANGISLNEVLMNGPKLQPDLVHILLKWRQFRYVFTADCTKMYRQVKVHPDDCWFQLIIWRASDDKEYKILRLKTVTYGTKPGGYLAVKAVMQLTEDEGVDYPLGVEILKNFSYIDDSFGGANSLDQLKEKMLQTSQLLGRGGFSLSKYCSNTEEALSDIPEDLREKYLEINEEKVIKALGVIWKPDADEFRFTYRLQPRNGPLTKNIVLSQLAQMFDPLGLVNPVVTKGKMLFQSICKAKIPWDVKLPEDHVAAWEEYSKTLPDVRRFRFPRSILLKDMKDCEIEFHGFCDASQYAYGACCYIKVIYSEGFVSTNLFQSRSRVTPLKKETVDITRLELEAALLLAGMVDDLRRNVFLELKIRRFVCWTDSSVVYHWLAADAHEFEIFVRNRVAKVQRLTSDVEWRHVPGEQNPADMISRGASIDKLAENWDLWLHGPNFITRSEDEWPKTLSTCRANDLPGYNLPEETALLVNPDNDLTSSMEFCVPYPGIRRAFAYVIRFIERCRSPVTRKARRIAMLPMKNKYKDVIIPTLKEAEAAEKRFMKSIQETSFAADYASIQSGHLEKVTKHLIPLAPFIDAQGILRVGGRLTRAHICYDAKHQVLLPRDHRYSQSILMFLHHFRLFHAGVQMMMRVSRELYWIISSRRVSSKIIHECLVCFRMRPRMASQLLGDFPELRVVDASAFLVTGVDLYGPFQVRHHARCKFTTTYYLALFVDFMSKAVHIEVVPDTTTQAFINALARFIADHGRVKRIYSDNATNFQGTANLLRKVQVQLTKDNAKIAAFCQQHGVEWSFIPARSPNFGGLWESSIKIAKGLMKAVMMRSTFTHDEFHTLVRQVAAVINSRPITPQSADPNDLEPLTPGHFVYGGPPSLLPLSIGPTESNPLKAYHNIQRKLQQYHERFQTEYLQSCQRRVKWQTPNPNVTVGTMVLLRKPNTLPMYWPIGRITEVYPDEQGNVRVVTVNTKEGERRRAISNIAPLPFNYAESSDKEDSVPPA